jgi:hypothetical protein
METYKLKSNPVCLLIARRTLEEMLKKRVAEGGKLLPL